MKTLSTTIAAMFVATGASAATIDFEAPLVAGNVVTSLSVGGVTVGVSASNNAGGTMDAMVFDTDNPTGGDTDLAATFYDAYVGTAPGPQDGNTPAPGANSLNPGNVLIISEDGDSSDPDDNGSGGQIVFTFSEAVTFMGFDVFDDVTNFSVTADTGDSETGITLDYNNQFASFTGFNWTGVSSLIFDFGNASGAIDNIQFEVAPVPLPAGAALMLTGLAGIGFASRRRKG